MVGAAAAGLDLTMPGRSLFGWLRRGAAAFAAGAALTAAVSLAAAYAVVVLHSRSATAGTIAPSVSIQTDGPIAAPPAAEVPIAPADDPPASPAASPSEAKPAVQPDSDPAPSQPPAADQSAAEAAGRYSVLVGSFRQNSEAGALVDQLRGLGYRARTGRVESAERGTWHQVSVGPYADLERARQDETRVRLLPGYADAHLILQ